MLRWRLKRRGFRGLQVRTIEVGNGDQDKESVAEEEFFKTGRKQAEERVERSVVRVQAMFRSKKAQEEYRRMKVALDQAKVTLKLYISLLLLEDLVFHVCSLYRLLFLCAAGTGIRTTS